MKTMKYLMAGALSLSLAGGAVAQTQGVSDDEITLGGATDLSGIFAVIGVSAMNGANLRFDEANEAGGVHGRKINYIVEDHGYQLPRASQALNKLVHRDKIFASFMTLGTPHNLAGFKIMEPRGIISLLPLSAARQMLSDPIDNKYTIFASYYDQSATGVKYLAENKDAKVTCSMYLPTDFGVEINEGVKAGTEELGLTFGAETTHKPDEQDFVGALQKLRAADCDAIVLALGIRQVITVVGTAKKLGWNDVSIMVTSAGFLDAVAAVPGGITDGLYATSGFVSLNARDGVETVDTFKAAYEAKYGEPANGFAMLGYTSADNTIRALEAAGKDLTTESFRAAMESLDYHSDLLDTQIKYTSDNHQGANDVIISVVEGGKWKLLERE